jgi:octaprenyl-diphosphate synthase
MAQLINLEQEKNKRKNALELLQELTAEDIKKVNELLVSKLGIDVPLIPKIANHLIQAGGKRLRPMLAIACAKLCDYEGERHIALSSCVEMLHTATLLHDDVVDESLYRRGEKSANAIWGNKPSILVGDFLLSKSFEIMVNDGSLKILSILANAASIISKGEVMQLVATNDIETNEAKYLQIIEAKTAELFASSCQIGAVISNKDKKAEEALRIFGLNLGIAFQLIDDVLDYSASLSQMGKSLGDDFREGKVTIPVILAYHRGDSAEKLFWKDVISKENRSENELKKAIELINKHNAIEDSIKRAHHYGDVAKDALGIFDNKYEKQILCDIVDFCIKRAY